MFRTPVRLRLSGDNALLFPLCSNYMPMQNGVFFGPSDLKTKTNFLQKIRHNHDLDRKKTPLTTKTLKNLP